MMIKALLVGGAEVKTWHVGTGMLLQHSLAGTDQCQGLGVASGTGTLESAQPDAAEDNTLTRRDRSVPVQC